MQKHSDCKNFIPVDVAKGLCAKTNKMVLIDTDTCDGFDQLHQCKNCNNFINPDKDNIGECIGLSDKGYWAMGDMTATTCEGYEDK